MTQSPAPGPAGATDARTDYEKAVAAYVEAGGEESVQRVITGIFGLTRKLDVWYGRQLADLGLSHGEWSVLARLATAAGGPLTPSRLAALTGVAPSSMTHRLDRMCERGLVERSVDPTNRTRIQVRLSEGGWRLFEDAVREQNVVESDILAGLTDRQRRELGRLLEVVIADLDRLDTD